MPIAVLTDLVAEGVPPAQATQSVLDLAREGRPDDEFVALRRQVQMQRRGHRRRPDRSIVPRSNQPRILR